MSTRPAPPRLPAAPSTSVAGLEDVNIPYCDVAGKPIDSGPRARCFAQYMFIHSLQLTGLNVTFMASLLVLFTLLVGVALVLAGVGFIVIGLGLLPPRPAAGGAEKSPA